MENLVGECAIALVKNMKKYRPLKNIVDGIKHWIFDF